MSGTAYTAAPACHRLFFSFCFNHLKPLSQPCGGGFRRQDADIFILQYLVVKLVARLDGAEPGWFHTSI
jgi:hypothetical protein